jgi:hypothetical protein
MSDDIIGRLLNSFQILGDAINNARENLTARANIRQEVLQRLDSYTDLLKKQRDVAHDLEPLIAQGQWQDVSQKIALINGLLDMIRTDARDVLASLAGTDHAAHDEDGDVKTPMLIC